MDRHGACFAATPLPSRLNVPPPGSGEADGRGGLTEGSIPSCAAARLGDLAVEGRLTRRARLPRASRTLGFPSAVARTADVLFDQGGLRPDEHPTAIV